MSRVVNSTNLASERERLLRMMREALESYPTGSDQSEWRDIPTFVLMILETIQTTVERTVQPWEKRDYWLKADQFRQEWAWAPIHSEKLHKALGNGDQAGAGELLAELRTRPEVTRQRPRKAKNTDQPPLWTGAWAKYVLKDRKGGIPAS